MLFRFLIDLSDVDRNIYQTLDFRIAQHPSEIASFLLTRVLAYSLQYQEGLEFSAAGLSDPEAPAIKKTSNNGVIDLWIEIGNASAKKLHKASKNSKSVVVYTYKNAEVLIADIKNNAVHRANDLEIYQIDSKFLVQLEKILEKNNRWSILHQLGQIDLSIGSDTLSTVVQKFKI
jgi:uncharacterized protein YaeQ